MDGFGLDNLPYGSVLLAGADGPRLCVRLHDQAVVLAAIADDLVAPGDVRTWPNLDPLLAAEPETWEPFHASIRRRLERGVPDTALVPLAGAELLLPFTVADYVDFYSSIEHATNVGRLFRPDAPLQANWRHVPIGYHGRAATVVVSGTQVRRPVGQRLEGERPVMAPSRSLDFELELACVVGGPSNPLGEPLTLEQAERRIFGFTLSNDWSARDIQRWEYVPLGPFLGKSFATSLSAWVVPSSILRPHQVPARRQQPEPLAYLRQQSPWTLAIDLEVELNGHVISRGSASTLYWTPVQQLVHCASNGAVVRPGDVLGSGAISGSEPHSEGSLLELSHGGSTPITVGAETRTYLLDGDEVLLRGRAGEASLGEVRGRISGCSSTA